MKKIYYLINIFFTFLLLFILFSTPIRAAPPANFQTTAITGSTLLNPTGFDIAPDGRIFIMEQKGKVYIYKNGNLLTQAFATVPVSQEGGDLGLLGIAFDPDFNTNHYIYFYYTSPSNRNSVARYDATNDVSSVAPVVIHSSADLTEHYHAGGGIAFGIDGKIYFSTGDNGYPTNGQNLNNSFGKIHRINKDGSVPTDNPFYGQANRRNTIWAYGFRNPFRFQINESDGKIYVGDVGERTWEEINVVTKAANYGWPTCEGNCTTQGMTNPMYAYNHNGNSASVTGGFVYRGGVFPGSYTDSYFFADYATGFIKNLIFNSQGGISSVNNFDLNAGTVVDLRAGSDGSFYYLNIYPARLYKVTYSVSNHTPVVVSSGNPLSGEIPLNVNFSSSGTSDQDNDALTYSWDFGDGTSSSGPNPQKTYQVKGKYTVILTVSDGVNQAQGNPITIQAGTAPNITVNSPINLGEYKAGDTINYSATGTDSSENNLPDSAFVTEVIFYHGTHNHPFLGPLTGKRTGSFVIPDTGENATDTYYVIKMTATDTVGLSKTAQVQINPKVVNLNFATNPTGFKVSVDSQVVNTPQVISSVTGFKREITTPAMTALNGSYYQFDSWSDGGVWKHFLKTPDTNSVVTANFKQTPPFNVTYYNNTTLTGTPVLTRSEGPVDHDFGTNAPAPGVNTDGFSVRYVKNYDFKAGTYKFDTLSDDGVKLFVNNQLIIDKWIDQSPSPFSANITLPDGTFEIKLEYYDRAGSASVKLSWEMVNPEATTPINNPITTFTLINSDLDLPISGFDPIAPNATINLATLPTRNLNIRANTNGSPIGSVRFAYDSNDNYSTENNPPYALASDNGGNYFAWTPTVGNHTVVAVPYPNQNAGGTAGISTSLSFNVINQTANTPTPGTGQSVNSFTLINADTEQPIAGFNPISPNAILNLQTLPTTNLNIRANTNPATVGSVKFRYDANANFATENNAPYALASDNSGNYNAFTPTVGQHTITAIPYTNQNTGGIEGAALTLSFTVTDQTGTPTPTPTPSPTPTSSPTPTGQSVVSLSLINADSDTAISAFDPLTSGSVLNFSTLPTRNLNIRANTNPDFVGSVRFALDSNNNFQTENIPPYALVGDDASNYFPWTPSVGQHSLTVTPYTAQGAGGTAGTPITINFSVSN